MAEFLTKLNVVLEDDTKNQGRGVWQVVSPLIFRSNIVGEDITVPTGFRTDFATVPRVPIFFDLFGDRAHAAATLHDYMYENLTYDRHVCDSILYEAMVASGVLRWRAKLMYLAVRIMGERYYGR